MSCGEAIAALKANKIQQAEDAWDAARQGGRRQCLPSGRRTTSSAWSSSIAYTQYRDAGSPAKREARGQAVHAARGAGDRRHGRLAARAVALGATSCSRTITISAATRSAPGVDLRERAKGAGQGRPARARAQPRGLDLSTGKRRRRRRCSTRSAARPPEALVNLGILRDRQGDRKKALELYKQARSSAARARRSCASGST